MDFRDLYLLLRRRIRFLILGLLAGALLGAVVAIVQHPVYEAATKILVSQSRQQSNADAMPMSIDQLVTTYLQLAKTKPVLNEVSSQVGFKIDPDNITVADVPNTQIIQIKVQDSDAQQAAAIANLLFQVLVKQNETAQASRYASYEAALSTRIGLVQDQISKLQAQVNQINTAAIQEQLTQVNQQIDQLQNEMTALEQDISTFPPSLSETQRVSLGEKQAQLDQQRLLLTLFQQIKTNLTFLRNPGQGGAANTDPQLAALQSTLNVYQQLNLSMVNDLENVRVLRLQNTPNISQLDPATPPKAPIRPLPLLYVMLAGLLGMIAAAGASLTMEHLDDTLRTAAQTEKLLNLRVLGPVLDPEHVQDGVVAFSLPGSAEAEAYRNLGASVGIASEENSARCLMVVNAGPGDNKTGIAANLATVNAQRGKRVILLDGNILSPYLHSLFGLENKAGLVQIMSGTRKVDAVWQEVPGIDGLTLITGGTPEKDSTKWLDIKKLGELFEQLRNDSDLVIVASPSAELADAQIFASKVDTVLLTIESGSTKIASALDALHKFRIIRAHVLGAVLYAEAKPQTGMRNLLPWAKLRLQENRKGLRRDKREAAKAPAAVSGS